MLKKIVSSLFVLLAISCKENMQKENTTKDFTLINAVPIGSTIIIETQSLHQFKTKLYESKIWEATKGLHWNKSTHHFFDQLLEIIPQKDHKENFIITSTLSGGGSFDYLLLKYVNAEEEKEYADRLKSNYNVSSIIYDKVNLYILKKGSDQLYFAIHNNIFLLSEEKLLVEEGIRQLNTDSSILLNENFRKIYEATDSNKDANIFIQYADFNQLAKNYFKNADTKWMKFLADYSAIELDFSSNTVELEGITIANFVKASYGSVFKGLKANDKKILDQLPNTIAALLYISVDDFTTFSQNYERYLNASQILFKKRKNLEKYNEYNPTQEFSKWIGKEVAVAYLSEEEPKIFNTLFIVESKDNLIAKEVLEKISNKEADYRGFEINQVKYETILQDVFGNYVKELKKPLYIIVDNYVVFANSESSLKSYVNDLLLQNYFVKNNLNKAFIKSFNSEGHIFTIGNGLKGIGLFKSFLNKEKASDYLKNEEALSKINHVGFQVNFDDHIGFTQCFINVDKNKASSHDLDFVAQLWNQSFPRKLRQIDLVQNHKTNEKEFAIQDEANTLYLVSNSGKKLWEKKFEEPILGKIHQMDIFKNGRLQLVFNTKSKLYVLDRNGKEVNPFPIKLKKPATAGCGLFDYNKVKNYRILVPQGATMTMYNQSGEVVTGFKYGMGKSIDRMPKHTRIAGKDYIVTTATDGSVIILTRVGTSKANISEKFAIKGDFNIIKDQIVFQTEDHKTVKIDFKGTVSQSSNASKDKMTKVFKNGTLHLLDDEVVFKGKNSIEYDLDEANDYAVDFYEDTDYSFLVVIDNTLKQVLVLDQDEKISNGFPVFGENKAQIYKEKGKYYLITQSSIDNSVLYYKLK
ncbi:MAG: DUF3352 domain-containing protein [Flavobacteriales bacterium]